MGNLWRDYRRTGWPFFRNYWFVCRSGGRCDYRRIHCRQKDDRRRTGGLGEFAWKLGRDGWQTDDRSGHDRDFSRYGTIADFNVRRSVFSYFARRMLERETEQTI